MKRIGNVASNRIFNPRNIRPAMPMDVDEVDGVMERFIRQKYETKSLGQESYVAPSNHTGSTSSEERTSQLPPKPTKRFNFSLRSTSSALPLPRTERSPPISPGVEGFGLTRRGSRGSPQRRSKPAKIFGADIGGSRADNYELKLIALKQMGFPDDRRNLTILKGENGNIDRAVATLIRLGEGSRASSGRSSPVPDTPPKDDDYVPGLVDRNAAAGAKGNPFERLDLQDKALPPPPVEEQIINSGSYNPFLQPTSPTLEQSFQGLQVARPSHLFPNITGGNIQSQPINTNPFLQTFTPPPQPVHQGHGFFGALSPFPPPQMTAEQPQATLAPSNPFLRKSASQTFAPSNPFMSQPQYQQQPTYPQPAPIYNPDEAFAQSQPALHNPFHSSTFPQPSPQPWAQNPGYITTSNYAESPISTNMTGNPFNSSLPVQGAYQQPMQTQRFDKASILALYNLPGTLSPTATSNDSSPFAQHPPQDPSQQGLQAFPQQHHPGQGHIPRRSVTMPVPGPNGLDMFSQPAPLPQPQQLQKLKSAQGPFGPRPGHESIDFVSAAGLLSGRHSPDMFAGLSARMR